MTFNLLTQEDLEKVFNFSKKQAAALMRTEGFPSFKIGSNYYVKAEKLDEYLDKNRETKLDYSKV